MQVKHISNIQYGLPMPNVLMMAVAKTGLADTFSITQSSIRYISKFPGQLTSTGTFRINFKDQAAPLFCVESPSFLAVTAD